MVKNTAAPPETCRRPQCGLYCNRKFDDTVAGAILAETRFCGPGAYQSRRPIRGKSMSLYSKEMELLSFVEALQAQSEGLRCRLFCRCTCEATFPPRDPYPVWKVHRFLSVSEARAWMLNHKDHEVFVHLQFEGIRPKDGNRRDSRSGQNQFAAGGKGPAKRDLLAEKLRALAQGTPYAQEAETALRKIAELNREYTEGCAGVREPPAAADRESRGGQPLPDADPSKPGE
jgi:hypothetical protein